MFLRPRTVWGRWKWEMIFPNRAEFSESFDASQTQMFKASRPVFPPAHTTPCGRISPPFRRLRRRRLGPAATMQIHHRGQFNTRRLRKRAFIVGTNERWRESSLRCGYEGWVSVYRLLLCVDRIMPMLRTAVRCMSVRIFCCKHWMMMYSSGIAVCVVDLRYLSATYCTVCIVWSLLGCFFAGFA